MVKCNQCKYNLSLMHTILHVSSSKSKFLKGPIMQTKFPTRYIATKLSLKLHWKDDFNLKNVLGNIKTRKQQKVLTKSVNGKDLGTSNVFRNDKMITVPENKVVTKTPG